MYLKFLELPDIFFRQRIIPFMWHLIHFFHANTFPVHSVLLLCPNRGTNIWHSPSKISFFVFKTPNLALNWHLCLFWLSPFTAIACSWFSLFTRVDMVESIYRSWIELLQLFRGTMNWPPGIRAAQGIEMSGSEIRIKHSLKGSPVKTLF